jgi:hypothetical protein
MKMKVQKLDTYCKNNGKRCCSIFGWINDKRTCGDCGHTVSDKAFYKIMGIAYEG